MKKEQISRERAYYLLLDIFREQLSSTNNPSFCDENTLSFHINPIEMDRDKVTDTLYMFSKKYSIEDGFIWVSTEEDTIFKIL